MKTLFRVSVLIAMALQLQSCEFKRVDTTKMAAEIQSRKVRHLTPSQIAAVANDYGQNICALLEKNKKRLEANPALTDSIAKVYQVDIRLLTPTDVSSAALDPKIRELVDAYVYNAENNIGQEPNLQKIKNGEVFVYTSPTASPKNPKELRIWCVQMPRKEIIGRIDIKAFGTMKVR